MALDSLWRDQVVDKDLKQASISRLSVRVNNLLELAEFVCEGVDLIGLLKHLELKLFHDLTAHFLVLEIQGLHRLLDYVRGEVAELSLDVLPDAKFTHQPLEALLHLPNIHVDLASQPIVVPLQEGLAKAARARTGEIWINDLQNWLVVLLAVIFQRAVLVLRPPVRLTIAPLHVQTGLAVIGQELGLNRSCGFVMAALHQIDHWIRLGGRLIVRVVRIVVIAMITCLVGINLVLLTIYLAHFLILGMLKLNKRSAQRV